MHVTLFLAHEYIYGRTAEVPLLPYLILKIASIGILDPLRKIAEEYKCGNHRLLQHCNILDFDIFSLIGRRRISTYNLLHVDIELRGGDDALAVLVLSLIHI